MCLCSVAIAQQPPSRIVLEVQPGQPTVININGMMLEIRVVGESQPAPIEGMAGISQALSNDLRSSLATNFTSVYQKLGGKWTKEQLNSWTKAALLDGWTTSRNQFIERVGAATKDMTPDQLRAAIGELAKGFK